MALAELNGDHTQQDVAHTLGVSKGAITNWKGGMRPDPEQVKAAARAYGVDALELLRIAYLDGDEPAEEPKPKEPQEASAPRQAPNRPPL
jgi:transcriptional regulator with XRE-family HTH domain